MKRKLNQYLENLKIVPDPPTPKRRPPLKNPNIYNLYLEEDEYDNRDKPNPHFNFRQRNELCTDVGGREYHQRKDFYSRVDSKCV
jgi:hypothetical protein